MRSSVRALEPKQLPPTPSMMVIRSAAAPGVGVVGQFLAVALMLLHAGLSTQPIPRPASDWWAECVASELAGPVITMTPGVLVRTGPGGATQGDTPAQSPSAGNWWNAMAQSKLTYSQPAGATTQLGQPTVPTAEASVPTMEECQMPATPQSPTTFIESLRLPPQTPILRSPPRARMPRDGAGSWVPRRSTWLAAKAPFKDPNPEKQAKRVLVHKWSPRTGHATHRTPDNAIADKFHANFSAPLSESKREAMQELFPCYARRGRRGARARR